MRFLIPLAIVVVSTLCQPAGSLAAGIDLAESSLNGNDFFEFPTSVGDLDFDVNFNSLNGVLLSILLDSNDQGLTQLTWSGFYSNSTATPWLDFHATLFGGPTFAAINDVSPDSGGSIGIDVSNAAAVRLVFGLPEATGLSIGAPGLVDFSRDWVIDLNGLGPGDAFQLQLAPSIVPEPSGFVLTLSGFVLCLLVARRAHRRIAG